MSTPLLLLQTLSGPAVRYERLVSLGLIHVNDGSCVDPTVPPRDEQVYITAFFDYLSYGLPLGICQAVNAPRSTQLLFHGIKDAHTNFAAASPKQPLPLVLAAIPNTDPVRWALASYLPVHPATLHPSTPTPPASTDGTDGGTARPGVMPPTPAMAT